MPLLLNEQHVDFLNKLKWMSAVLVLFGHLRRLIFDDYVNIEVTTPVITAFYVFTSVAHEAVIVFFVLSGYLVAHPLFGSQKERFQPINFSIKRVSRVYTVLLPSLIFTYLITELLGFLEMRPWDTGTHGHSDLLREAHSDFKVLIQNVFGLQGLLTPIYGYNFPLWSLGFETFFYVTVVSLGLLGHYRWRLFIFLLAVYGLVNTYFALCLLLFLVGGACRHVPPPQKIMLNSRAKLIACFSGMIMFSIVDRFAWPGVSDVGLALIVCMLCLIPTRQREQTGPNISLDFTYTLYLFHYPLSVLLVSVTFALTGFGYGEIPSLPAAGLFISLSVANLIFSYFIYLAFERHTKRITEVLIEYFASRRS